MAGAYLQIFPQDSYTFSSNVLLAGVPQELGAATVWFTAQATGDYGDSGSFGASGQNNAPFINLCSTIANITISNGVGINVNSLVTISIGPELTANMSYVNTGFWSLVTKTAFGDIYTLDHGRIAVVPRVGISYA